MRPAKLLVAYAGCVLLSVLSVVLAWATTGTPPLSTTGGFAAHLIAAATGVGVARLRTRPCWTGSLGPSSLAFLCP